MGFGVRAGRGLGRGLRGPRGPRRGGKTGEGDRLETLGAKFKLLEALVKPGVDGGSDGIREQGADGAGHGEAGCDASPCPTAPVTARGANPPITPVMFPVMFPVSSLRSAAPLPLEKDDVGTG